MASWASSLVSSHRWHVLDLLASSVFLQSVRTSFLWRRRSSQPVVKSRPWRLNVLSSLFSDPSVQRHCMYSPWAHASRSLMHVCKSIEEDDASRSSLWLVVTSAAVSPMLAFFAQSEPPLCPFSRGGSLSRKEITRSFASAGNQASEQGSW